MQGDCFVCTCASRGLPNDGHSCIPDSAGLQERKDYETGRQLPKWAQAIALHWSGFAFYARCIVRAIELVDLYDCSLALARGKFPTP